MDQRTKKILKQTKDALDAAVAMAKKRKEEEKSKEIENRAMSNVEKLLFDITEQIRGNREEVKKSEMETMMTTFQEITDITSKENKLLLNEEIKQIQNYIDKKALNVETITDAKIKEIKAEIPIKFDQEDIKALDFKQINHTDSDHKKTIKSISKINQKISEVKETLKEKERLLNNKSELLKEKIDNLKFPLKHNELEDIFPDDHHAQLHTIESHLGLEATTNDLNRLVEGENVDDLHTHKFISMRTLVGGGAAIVSDEVYGVSWDGDTIHVPSKNAVYDKIETLLPLAGGTMAGNIVMPDGGTIGQAAGPLIAFDDTLNYLEITGCKVGIGTTAPTHALTLSSGLTGIAIYNTADQTSNYERAIFKWSSNAIYIGGEKGGSGSARVLRIRADNDIYIEPTATKWVFKDTGHFIASTDNTCDIGSSGANRPRDVFLAGEITASGTGDSSIAGKVGIGVTAPLAKLHIDQATADAVIPVLYLDQADVSEEIAEIVSTAGVGNAIELVGAKTLTVTEFIKVTINGAVRYIAAGTIA